MYTLTPTPGAAIADGAITVDKITPHLSSDTPSDPAATASTTAVMAGLAIAFTPTKTGNIKVKITGEISNDTVGDGSTVAAAYGTGTAPANGDAATGTAMGNTFTFTSTAASDKGAFAIVAYVTGLTIGTAYWLDLSILAVTGGNAGITNISYIVEEW